MLIDRADPFATANPDARLIKLLIRAHRFNATLASSAPRSGLPDLDPNSKLHRDHCPPKQPTLLAASAADIANRTRSTAVLEYGPTETLPLLGSMLLGFARLCRRCHPHGRRNGGKLASFLGRRRTPERDRLSAGGERIRTSGSWMQVEHFLAAPELGAANALPILTG